MVLYNLCEALRYACVMLAPFLPSTADKMAAQLALPLPTGVYFPGLRRQGRLCRAQGRGPLPPIDAARELAELAAGARPAAGPQRLPSPPQTPARRGPGHRAPARNYHRRFLQMRASGGQVLTCETLPESKSCSK